MSQTESQFWLNPVLDTIEAKFPDGEVIVSSGISPSASYHVGHFREILSADAITLGLKQRGRDVRHLHVVDNFDPLRKRYAWLPEEYERYVGWPVSLVPDPHHEAGSYAEYYFNEFRRNIDRLNIQVEIISSYDDLYKSGKMAPQIEKVLEKNDVVRQIFAEISGRELEPEWTPVQVMDENNVFQNARLSSWDKANQTLEGVRYDDGKAKLNWRLDWPARWQVLGVQVEPHSRQEHGAAGGSYDTGIRFSEEVFGYEPPMPAIKYGNIHLKGDRFKMSSSKGNLITPEQAFEIMPPEMLRYMVLRFPGTKDIQFDPGLGLYNMMDEFATTERAVRAGEPAEYEAAYRLATSNMGSTHQVSSIPFSHVVSVYQTSQGNFEKAVEIFKRSEDPEVVDKERNALEQEFTFAGNWLKSWAPDSIKFTVQPTMPEVELSDIQLTFLNQLADRIEEAAEPNPSGEWYHNTIYEVKDAVEIAPAEGFAAIYQIILGKSSGPKAGFFLSTFDPSWLINRFRQKA